MAYTTNVRNPRRRQKFSRKIKSMKRKASSTCAIPAKRFAKAVKQVILQTAEPKQHRTNYGKIELYHNSGSPATGQQLHQQIWLDGNLPAQGLGDTARVGDEIVASRIHVKTLVGMKADRHNVTFRIIVFRCTASAYPTTVGQLMIATTGNVLLDDLNKDRFSVVRDYQKKVVIHPDLSGVGGADKEYTFPMQMSIPCKQKFKFETDGSVNASNKKNLYCQVMAYDAYGTLLTDNIAYIQMTSSLYYKDP